MFDYIWLHEGLQHGRCPRQSACQAGRKPDFRFSQCPYPIVLFSHPSHILQDKGRVLAFFVYFCKKGLEKVTTAKRRQYALANNAEKHHR